MKKWLFLFLLPIQMMLGQDYYPTNSGVKTNNEPFQAIVNATIHLSPSQTLENATLLTRDGVVVAVGKDIVLPPNTRIYDKNGLHVYPSFIDLHTTFGVAEAKRSASSGRSAQYEASREGFYWNDHILSDYNSFSDFKYDKKAASALRDAGFGVVNAHRADGIHRGTSVLVALSDDHADGDRILSNKSASHFSFRKSVGSAQSYPSSVMGAMALLRQFYYDLDWYRKGNAKNRDYAIEAAINQESLPKIFEAGNQLNVLRALKIGKEMNLSFSVVGSGFEYENIAALRAFNKPIILPLNFPKAYDTSDPLLLSKTSLQDLRQWNQAPMNPAAVAQAGIPIALTTATLKSPKDFLGNVRKAIAYGLTEVQALEALTTQPAKILGAEQKIGQLKKGFMANFIVTSGPVFDQNTTIYENWVKGHRHELKDHSIVDIDGTYQLILDQDSLKMTIKNSLEKISVEMKRDSIKLNTKSSYVSGWFNLTIVDKKAEAFAQLQSKLGEGLALKGQGTGFDGEPVKWTASAQSTEKSPKKSSEQRYYPPQPITFPNKAFGFEEMPKQESVLFRNATVWTNESEGILSGTDVLISNGKIEKIGKNLASLPGVKEIDASGKHLTSGIIDEHSHLAASSINEGGQNSSAEVSIEDVIEHDDSGIFRDLAGGVTTIQILHGSANPIGGQSAIIKLKWGESAENLLYPNADPFIKFALGENVKQSNWSSFSRFPQTRMGVEQVFVDYFQRAKEYGASWDRYQSLSRKQQAKTTAPRYDVEMEVLWQILKGERFISCHSYVQSEINMLMKVAERFNFKVNTFTHILEGYKVADKMAEHGVGGSTFSDWWAYKYEVNDAIPFNGPIMHDVGVTVAYNSDDAEMSRRLNQEAAKAVKYGGVSEEEAWKFVTLNPAKLLHLDDRIGSIKVGKDADLVLWSDHPMSIYSKAEKTMIEGVVYYDANRIPEQLEAIQKERQLLIGQLLDAKSKGEETQAPRSSEKREFHCETLDQTL